MVQSAGIESLPNELFVYILISFPTRTLLPLASISHRFHDLVLRIFHNRLVAAAALENHNLILECFHPSAKLTTPSLACVYLGTDGLSNKLEGQGPLYDGVERTEKLGKLASLYSQFHPVSSEQDRRPQRRQYPIGDVPSYPDNSGGHSSTAHDLNRVPSQIINFEPHELFSQLCTIANIVKIVPNVGFLLNCVTIGEGVIRIWRDWLAAHAVVPDEKKILPLREPSSQTVVSTSTADDRWSRVLWLDDAKDIGIRVRVIDREDLGTPILSRVDEDVHVAYSIEFEELVIRTMKLLLKIEESVLQNSNESGNAIVRIL